MDDVSFKDIRVLPPVIDLKSNFSKYLPDLLGQLQSGLVLKGLVVGNTPKGEIILHTRLGRLIIPEIAGFKAGETLTLRLANDREQISGNIITVSHGAAGSKETVTLAFVRNTAETRNFSAEQTQKLTDVLDADAKLPAQIKGDVTYLNLSRINKSSLLYKILDKAGGQDNRPFSIILKTTTSNDSPHSPLQIQGEISSNEKDGIQLIKTNFGIITTTGTRLPIGQKITFEIAALGGQESIPDLKKGIADFIFHLNKDWPSAKTSILSSALIPGGEELPGNQGMRIGASQIPGGVNALSQLPVLNPAKRSGFEKDDTDSEEEIKQRALEKQDARSEGVESRRKSDVSSLLKRFSDHKVIKEVLGEYNSVKELLVTSEKAENDAGNWYSLMIPFYNGQKVADQEIKFNRPAQNLLRFIIDIDLEISGRIRMDGLIKFHDSNMVPVDFDLIISSGQPLTPELGNGITEIFNLGKQMSGIKGNLSFDVKEPV